MLLLAQKKAWSLQMLQPLLPLPFLLSQQFTL
jgi:hypothetical protein